MNDKRSPCAANAIFLIRQIGINGKMAGIIRLDESIREVMALNPGGDDTIRSALLQCVARNNYIPPGVCDTYADSLMAVFSAEFLKQQMDPAFHNSSALDNVDEKKYSEGFHDETTGSVYLYGKRSPVPDGRGTAQGKIRRTV